MRRRLLSLMVVPVVALAVTSGLEAQRRARPRPVAPAPRPAAAAPVSAAAAPAPPPLDAPLAGARSPRNASYLIHARLDPVARTIQGREVITWRNISRVAATELRFHLYYNAWRNAESTWMREGLLAGRRGASPARDPADWGRIDVTAIRLVGVGSEPPIDLTAAQRFVQPDDENRDDRTVMAVSLPRPVEGGQAVNVEIEWTSQVPRTFSRTGAVGRFFFLAQWFPKIGVFEDGGWNCHQFHAGTEFYADYGIYDAHLTVPRGWVVGATGRERERRDNGAETTHRYYEEDVHDFAWTTSPDYLERRARFEHRSLPPVEMRLLLQPEHASQAERHFAATRAALQYYGEWFGPYPYGHVTIIDPAWRSGAGGMEYPTLFTAGTRWLAPARVNDPEGVTVHECGHQFWYGIVGNNEFEHAWLDEGLNTFSTGRAVEQAYKLNYHSERYFGGLVPLVFKDIPLSRDVDENGMARYRDAAESDLPSTPSYRYWPGSGGGISYSKTALWLHTLERHLGWATLQRILSTFFERWKFRHPKPGDFFAVVNQVSGRDMTWYFDQVYRSSNVFDYGVAKLESAPAGPSHRTSVVARRYGEAIFPVDVLVTFENGDKVRERWDGRDRWRLFTYERPVRVTSAEVDPDRVLLLDVDRTNNSRTMAPAGPRAARKWMWTWIVWFQDLLATYAFFV